MASGLDSGGCALCASILRRSTCWVGVADSSSASATAGTPQVAAGSAGASSTASTASRAYGAVSSTEVHGEGEAGSGSASISISVSAKVSPPPTPIRPLAPAAPPAAPDDTSPSLAGTPEVRPPSDLQGPGWAFASARVPIAPSDEALHEEARRLARLLVSEIKLYNEEQVEEGRRKRDIYERLREDIDRSRQMYEERVEPRILKTTDYFYQELVRILAAGDARALGI